MGAADGLMSQERTGVINISQQTARRRWRAESGSLPHAMSNSPPGRGLTRWLELVLLFGMVPGALALGPAWLAFAAIPGSGALCLALLLRDRTFERRRLWDGPAARRG